MAEQDPQVQTAESSATHAPIPSARQKSARVSKRSGPKLNERGVPVTNWDNPENDPNLRHHSGDDPEGTRNKLGPVPGDNRD